MEKRVLSVQDLSCLGQCSMAAALPVLSACGVECAVLPTALLSTHTGAEFTPPHIRSLRPETAPILNHWKEMGLTFDGVEIGYLGDAALISTLSQELDGVTTPDTLIALDPVMGDNGRFYSGFDRSYAAAMRSLCTKSSLLLPNLTEACLLLERPMAETYSERDCVELAQSLLGLGPETVVLTGLALFPGQLTNLVCTSAGYVLCNHPRMPGQYHGTGDLFAAACVGRMVQGDGVSEAVRRAGEFVCAAIAATPPDKGYGTCFEGCLHLLWE